MQTWSDTAGATDIADFGGLGGAVNLSASLGALGLIFEVDGYTLSMSSRVMLTLGTSGISTVAGTSTISGSITLAGAQVWNVAPSSTLTLSAKVVNGGFTLNLASAGTTNLSGVISGDGGLTKTGAGTVTLIGDNTYKGDTTVNRGTLNVGSSVGGSISSNSALVMGGGTLNYNHTGNNIQTFRGTTLNPGASSINNNVSTSTVDLGALDRKVGATVDFNSLGNSNPGTIMASSASGSSNILGGYATYNRSDWATISGSNIGAFSGYRTYNSVNSLPAGADLTDNYNTNYGTGHDGYDGSATNNVTINSLRFNTGSATGDNNADPTININGGQNLTIASGGILVTSNLGIKYAKIQGGGLTTTGSDIVIQQNNAATAGHLVISSSVFDSTKGTPVGLTKSGTGYFELSADSPYTGATTVNGGTMQLNAAITGTASVTINNSGTLLFAASNRINDSATVTLNGGTLNLGGKSEGSAGTNGVGALTLTASSTLDFGTTGSSNLIQFGGVGAHTPGSSLLQIVDFEGTPNGANGTDRLLFAGTSSAFTSLYLQTDVSFNGVLGYGVSDFGSYFEVYPVPEPATWAAGVLTFAAVGWKLRRRQNLSAT